MLPAHFPWLLRQAYMLKYDTVHKSWPGHISGSKEGFMVEGRKLMTFSERCEGKALSRRAHRSQDLSGRKGETSIE